MKIVHCLVGAFGIFGLAASARNLDDNHKVVAGVRYYTAITPHKALVGCQEIVHLQLALGYFPHEFVGSFEFRLIELQGALEYAICSVQ